MKFDKALELLQAGSAVRRLEWSQGNFLFKQVPARIDISIVPKMTSLPEEIKNIFIERSTELYKEYEHFNVLSYKNLIVRVNAMNNIKAWSPSIDELEADDWVLYDNKQFIDSVMRASHGVY